MEPMILWGYGKLYIWKSELIFPSDKWNYSKLTHCSQTCSDDRVYKMTTRLRWPMLSPPQRIPMQSLLYNTISCLMQPVTIFFVSQMKKSLKQRLKNFIQQRNGKQTQGTMHKRTHLSLFIFTPLLLFNAKFIWCLQMLGNL